MSAYGMMHPQTGIATTIPSPSLSMTSMQSYSQLGCSIYLALVPLVTVVTVQSCSAKGGEE